MDGGGAMPVGDSLSRRRADENGNKILRPLFTSARFLIGTLERLETRVSHRNKRQPARLIGTVQIPRSRSRFSNFHRRAPFS